MEDNKKIRLLLLIHLPPPMHGVSIINSQVEVILRNSKIFNVTTIPIKPNKNLNGLKRISIWKIIYSTKLLFTLLIKIIVFRPQKLYFTPTPKSPAFFRDIILILIAKVFNIKIFLHFHRQGLKILTKKTVFARKLIGFALKKCTLIHLTPYLVEQEFVVTKLNKKASTHFIPNPLVIPPTYFQLPKKNKSQILFFSNLIYEKGVLELINSMPNVIKQKTDVKLFISGGIVSPSYYTNIIEKIKELNLKEYVVVMPNPSEKEKITLFNESEIFVLPSNEDCFPLVIIEAFSYNLPVVTTNVGGLSTVFDEKRYNIQFTTNDPEKLSSAICNAFEQTNRNPDTSKQLKLLNNTFSNSLMNILSSE